MDNEIKQAMKMKILDGLKLDAMSDKTEQAIHLIRLLTETEYNENLLAWQKSDKKQE